MKYRLVLRCVLASALLAVELEADMMLILTNVNRVSINYGTPNERQVETMSVAQAKKWLAEGQFPAGSMGPKVQGAVNFIEASKKSAAAAVVIGPLHCAADAVAGRIGTRVTRDAD